MKAWRKIFACLLLGWVSTTFVISTAAATVPSRTEVFRLLRQEHYDQLEEIVTELRQEKPKFYSGPLKLSKFYALLEISQSLDDKTWTDHIDRLEKWAKARPDSPTPLVALGKIYTSYAWKARGSGYASTVSDEGWKLFGQRLRHAKTCLETASKMPVKDPEAYNELITVAMGLSESKLEVDAIFNAGVEVEPNYLPLYYSEAYCLLPRWLGQPGDWERFCADAADARGGEEGDMLYMIIARSQAWTEGNALFQRTQISYPRMKRGFEASLKRNPAYLYDMNSFCYFACIAADKGAATNLFQNIGGRWEKAVWKDEATFQIWQNWALNGAKAPRMTSRYSSVVTGESRQMIRQILVIGGAVWLVLITAVGVGFWLLIRSGDKRN